MIKLNVKFIQMEDTTFTCMYYRQLIVKSLCWEDFVLTNSQPARQLSLHTVACASFQKPLSQNFHDISMVKVTLIDRSHFRIETIIMNSAMKQQHDVAYMMWTVKRGSDASRYLWEFSRFQLYRSKRVCCHAVSEETSAETGPSTQPVCVSVPKQKRSDPQALVQAPTTQPEETDIQLQQSSSPSQKQTHHCNY